MIPTGEMNRKVKIERPNPLKDAMNVPLPGYVQVFELWGKFLTATGMSTIRNAGPDGVQKGVNAYSLRIRYRPVGIDESMRVNYKDQSYFDIIAIKHDHANKEWTDLILQAGAKDG